MNQKIDYNLTVVTKRLTKIQYYPFGAHINLNFPCEHIQLCETQFVRDLSR